MGELVTNKDALTKRVLQMQPTTKYALFCLVQHLMQRSELVNTDKTILSVNVRELSRQSSLLLSDFVKALHFFWTIGIVEIQGGEDKTYGYSLMIKDRNALSLLEKIITTNINQENDDKPIFELSVNEDALTLSINEYVICKFRWDSAPLKFMQYLCANSNQKITLKDISNNIKDEVRNPQKIFDNCGLKGNLRKLFFDSNKTNVILYNPVTEKRLKNLKISKEKVTKILKTLQRELKK